MRIAIEALGIHYVGGGRTATLNLLEPLFELDTHNEYLVILTQPEPTLATAAGNVKQWIAPTRNRFAVRLWAQLMLPVRLRRFDLTHFVKNLGVFAMPTPTIVTVHDLTQLIHPEIFPVVDVWYWRYIEGLTLRAADRVIAVSQTTARELAQFYPISDNNIRVIYNGIGSHFRPATVAAIVDVRRRYSLPDEYLICVGHLDRKKNLTMLVEALGIFHQRLGRKIKLVLVGEEYPRTRDEALYGVIDRLGLRDTVIFTGRVPDADVPPLFSGALVALFPSWHEGFGLSAVEAMACGTPLVANAAGGLLEVATGAAELVSSRDAAAFADALFLVASDENRRRELRKRGLERAGRFQRETTAKETLKLYKEIAG